MTEPWLLGSLPDLDPVISHLVRAGQHIRQDIEHALAPLEPIEIRVMPLGLNSAGFHAKHLAGSTERLCTYLAGRALTAEQLAAISLEGTGTETASELIHRVNQAMDLYEKEVRSLKPEDFAEIRYVGRARLPVTSISLAIHIAEHGQRHVGQAIAAAKLAKALRNG